MRKSRDGVYGFEKSAICTFEENRGGGARSTLVKWVLVLVPVPVGHKRLGFHKYFLDKRDEPLKSYNCLNREPSFQALIGFLANTPLLRYGIILENYSTRDE